MSYILCKLGRKTGKIISRVLTMVISRFGIVGDFFVCVFSIFSMIKKTKTKTMLTMATIY